MYGMYLTFDKVPDSCFGHYGYGDCVHDLFDHFGVAHTGYATLGSDVGWHSLERHDG
jgi:hypothetical protein